MFTQSMSRHRHRSSQQGRGRTGLVASTQQLLVLGVVLAALVPAATVVDLKVVRPGELPVSDNGSGAGSMAGYVAAATTPSAVPGGPVTARLRNIALTRPLPKGVRSGRGIVGRLTGAATQARPKARTTVITSAPQAVPGFGTVGLTWARGAAVSARNMTADVRTLKDGRWSAWQRMDVDDHGPDPGSAEVEHARPGTMEALVGRVEKVQTRMRLTGTQAPADLKLAVITPGRATSTKEEKPAIDTGAGDDSTTSAPPVGGSDATGSSTAVAASATSGATSGGSAATLSAAAYTPKPQIFSRRQWGADEKVREQTPPDYFEVHGGFVHHTVNTNSYSRADVPGIIRSIYVYHVRSRGWRDIGYNFLVDKFGRIWEGRYGGVDRPVVGAHTQGYNSWSFGASAIGNFDTARPSSALLQAFGALFAWKLSLHGVRGNAGSTTIGPKTFSHAIMGHRDTKSTACPGKYLYAQIPTIRSKAGALQKGWAARELQSNISGSGAPDLVARNAASKRIYVIRTDGSGHFGPPIATNLVAPTAVTTMNAGDWNRDGHGDILLRFADGTIRLYKGNGSATFHTPGIVIGRNFQKASMIDVVSDMTGDGYPDIEGRHPNGQIRIWPGHGGAALGASYVSHSAISGATMQIGAGRWNSDGAPDVLVKVGTGLRFYPGNGPGGIMDPVTVSGVNLTGTDFVLAVKDIRNASTGSDLLVRNAVTGVFTAYEHKAGGGGWDRKTRMGVVRGFDQIG